MTSTDDYQLGCRLVSRTICGASSSWRSRRTKGLVVDGLPNVAILFCLLLCLAGTPAGARAKPDGARVPTPYRRCPVAAGWIVPSSRSTTFCAAVACEDGDIRASEWRLTGPSEDTQRKTVFPDRDEVVSTYQCMLEIEGHYKLTCTFVDNADNCFSISWNVSSAANEFAGLGREVDPAELGSMVFLEGGMFKMGLIPTAKRVQLRLAPGPPSKDPILRKVQEDTE